MPRMIGLGLYRLDINFRESAVVGIVGGGGIGATLNTAFDRYEFDSAAAILLIIIGIVMLAGVQLGLRPQVGAVEMPVATQGELRLWQRRTTRFQLLVWGGWLIAVAIFVACWQLISEKTIWAFVADAPQQAGDIASRMVPPEMAYMVRAVAGRLGHHQHRHPGHAARARDPGRAGGLLRGAQHDTRAAPSCARWRSLSSSRRARSTR